MMQWRTINCDESRLHFLLHQSHQAVSYIRYRRRTVSYNTDKIWISMSYLHHPSTPRIRQVVQCQCCPYSRQVLMDGPERCVLFLPRTFQYCLRCGQFRRLREADVSSPPSAL
jgi:hypothetical protein